MSLRDLMRTDVAAVFLSTQDLGQTATFTPHGATGTPSTFDLSVTVGDESPSVTSLDGGMEDRQILPVFANRVDTDAGILAIEGAARIPKRGDSFVIATGEDAGTYLVQHANFDTGGGIVMTCAVNRLLRVGAQNAVQVR